MPRGIEIRLKGVWGEFGEDLLLNPLNRYQAIIYRYRPPKPEPWDPNECPGLGQCHGCLSWCPACGTVSDVCFVEWPGKCRPRSRKSDFPKTRLPLVYRLGMTPGPTISVEPKTKGTHG